MKFKVGDKVDYLGSPGTIKKIYPSTLHYDVHGDNGLIFGCVDECFLKAIQAYVLPTSGSYHGSLPPGFQASVEYGQIVRMSDYSTTSAYDYFEDEKKKKEERKLRGECETCGKLRPMSIHGLLDCPDHPTPLPSNHKQ